MNEIQRQTIPDCLSERSQRALEAVDLVAAEVDRRLASQSWTEDYKKELRRLRDWAHLAQTRLGSWIYSA